MKGEDTNLFADSVGDDLYNWDVQLWKTAFRPDCQLAQASCWLCVIGGADVLGSWGRSSVVLQRATSQCSMTGTTAVPRQCHAAAAARTVSAISLTHTYV
jgi:hypothetical protein